MDARLIIDEPSIGTWNMALDDALLDAAAEQGIVCLRFYRWSEATVSLGYFQDRESRQTHKPSRELPLVRRATGGGAIVHDAELTYSFATPIADRFSKQPSELVNLFHGSLCETLSEFRTVATLCRAPVATDEPPFLCFQRRAENDVLVGRHKIAGSAQRRRKNAVLQHGSVLMATSRFAPELPGIAEMSPSNPLVEDLIEAWRDKLSSSLSARFYESQVSRHELASAKRWQSERFANDAWNRRR